MDKRLETKVLYIKPNFTLNFLQSHLEGTVEIFYKSKLPGILHFPSFPLHCSDYLGRIIWDESPLGQQEDGVKKGKAKNEKYSRIEMVKISQICISKISKNLIFK